MSMLPRCFTPLPLLLSAALLAPVFLAGCGGGGLLRGASQPLGIPARAVGAAAFAVKWPVRAASPRLGSRLIPVAANSVVLTIKRGGTVIITQTLVRPAAGVTLPGLPVGPLTVTAATYPSLDGTGVAQASATAPLVIVSGQTTLLTLTLADTISVLHVTSTAQSLPLGGTLALTATAYDASGNVVLTGGSIGWSSSNTSIATVSASGVVSGLAVGNSQITATDSESGVSGVFAANCVQSAPYGSIAAAIPGQVEAENYDLGGEGVAYHDNYPRYSGAYRSDDIGVEATSDTGGGYNIGYVSTGEWLKYTVNSAGGNYIAGFRVASIYSGKTLHLEDNYGNRLTGIITCPNTGGYQNWQTVTATLKLPAGIQTLKLVMDNAPFNINFMTFQQVSFLVGKPFDDGAGSYHNSPDIAANAFDGDINTFYDCSQTTGGYTGIDLGSAISISSITFAPRLSNEYRMPGGVFEGSNTSATSGYVTLAAVTQSPTDGFTNTLTVTDATPYRWLRYRGPSNGNCNVAEIQFYH